MMTEEKTTPEHWNEIQEKITAIRNGSKGVVFVLDKDGWFDISTGAKAFNLLDAIEDWHAYILKNTKIIREKL